MPARPQHRDEPERERPWVATTPTIRVEFWPKSGKLVLRRMVDGPDGRKVPHKSFIVLSTDDLTPKARELFDLFLGRAI